MTAAPKMISDSCRSMARKSFKTLAVMPTLVALSVAAKKRCPATDI